MATVNIRRSGFSAGVAGPGRTAGDLGSPRGDVVGWTRGAARRNTEWLQSVDGDRLPGDGLALTLTIGSWPASSEEYGQARRAFLKRAARDGWTLQHWVVESTRLGRPHLHIALYGGRASRESAWLLVLGWLTIADRHGWTAVAGAQHVVPITSLTGWLQYVSKHGSRGVTHYQRSTVPSGWSKTGRLWGHAGAWPCPEPLSYDLTEAEFHRFRRLAVSYARSRLRASGASSTVVRRVGSQMRSPDPARSIRAGIGYWMDRDMADALVTASLGREPVIRYHDWE